MPKYKQFAVLGLGRFGQSIAKTLLEHGCEVLCCDIKIEKVNEMDKYGSHLIQADVMDSNALDEMGLNNFDIVIVAIGDNLEASLMVTLAAKEKGVPLVIAKAKNDTQRVILERVGADRVILPERDMGIRIATTLVTTSIIDYIDLSDKFAIAEIEAKSQWIGKTIQKSNIRATTGLNIVAIKRNEKVLVSPTASEIIFEKDILIVIGENSNIQRLK